MGLARSCKSEVSTVISHTETQWENAIEKIENVKQMWVQFWVWA